jgi:hypothetical protein
MVTSQQRLSVHFNLLDEEDAALLHKLQQILHFQPQGTLTKALVAVTSSSSITAVAAVAVATMAAASWQLKLVTAR